MAFYLLLLAVAGLIVALGHLRVPRLSISSSVTHGRRLPEHQSVELLTMSGVLLVALFSTIAGIRYFVGTDFPMYANDFLRVNPHSFLDTILSQRYEYGFTTLMFLSRRISTSPESMFWIMGTVIAILTAIAYHLLTDSVPKALLLWLLFGMFFFSLNGIRQAIAAPLIMISYYFLHKRKYFPFMVFVGIALLFHVSSIMAVPLLIIFQRILWSWRKIVILVLGIVVLGAGILFSGAAQAIAVAIDPRYIAYFQQRLVAGNSPYLVFGSRVILLLAIYFGTKKVELSQIVFVPLAIIATGGAFWFLARYATWFWRLDASLDVFIPVAVLGALRESSGHQRKLLWIVILAWGFAQYTALLLAGFHNLIPFRTWP